MNRRRVFAWMPKLSLRRTLLLFGPLVFSGLNGPASLVAQEARTGELPVIEPRLTKIIGSDTLQIRQAVLSPTGSWVVYSAETPGGERLWIIPVTGGEPKLLVDMDRVSDPIWFPRGDRIAFRSSANSAIMTVAFDPEAGSASGTPRRVTLDAVYHLANIYRISPDGEWIAYKVQPEEGGMLIRIVPSSGGTARTLVQERTNRVFLQDFSADGRHLYYRRRNYDNPSLPGLPLFRVAVDGGTPELVTQPPERSASPESDHIVERVSSGWVNGSPYEIRDYFGTPLARIVLPENASTMGAGLTFSADETKLLAVVSNEVSPLRVLPVEGGSPRQIGETQGSEKPLGWSPDGQEILFATSVDGRISIMSAPVEGGAAREVGPIPDPGALGGSGWSNPLIISSDGHYVFYYSRPNPGTQYRTLFVRPIEGGESRIISDSVRAWGAFGLAGRGGTPLMDGESFLYGKVVGDREVELRATPPEGPSRLLRQDPLPSPEFPYFAMGVFGDRVVYGKDGSRTDPNPSNPDDIAGILVAKGPEGEMKEVASLPGAVTFDDIVFSYDGRWIAANTYYIGEDGDCCVTKVVVVGVTEDGEVSVPARAIDTPIPGSAWSLRWLPDQSAVILYGQRLPDWDFDVFLIPVRNGGRPVALTRDDPDYVDINLLSPDGKYIAYQAFVDRGTSLWLADLGNALANLSRSR